MARPSDRLRSPEDPPELNLAPIMNMVMILIPLLLLSASFVVVATLKVHSPRNQANVNPDPEPETEEVPVPRVLVAITEDGFTVSDLRQSPAFLQSNLGAPLPECSSAAPADGGVPVTICNANSAQPELLRRLNWRGLYNRLVEIKNFPGWAAQWDDSNAIINIVADREIPVEVVIRTMDVSRFLLENDAYGEEAAFRAAQWRLEEERPVALFQDPVLLLPRAAAD